MVDNSKALTSLRWRWLAYLIICLAFLVAGFSILQSGWEAGYARRWLGLAAAGMIYPLVLSWRELRHNYRPGETALLPGLGPGNWLTLLRGMLVAGLMGFLLLPWPSGWLAWIPAVLYILSNATDFFDGYLARRSGHATRLGEILDMSLDGWGVLVASLLIVQYQQVPVWYLLVAFARYLFVAGLWLRRRLDKPVYELPPSAMRRAFAGWQNGFLAVMLVPIFAPPGTIFAAVLFALPFLAGFLRDWLFVSGVIQRPRQFFVEFQRFLENWLPLVLRLALFFLAFATLPGQFQAIDQQSPFLTFVSLLEATVILMVCFGIAGRIAAITGLVILGIHQFAASLMLSQYLMVGIYTAILYLGPGLYSVWKPEEYLVFNHAGEARRARGFAGADE